MIPSLPRCLGMALGCSLVLLATPTGQAQQAMSPDQQAEQALVAGSKAFNEGNYPFAAQRYAEVIQKFPNTRSAVAARYGLGVVLINSPEQDFTKAVEHLLGPAGDGGFADRGLAMYHLAVAQRGLGLRELEQAVTKPQEAEQRKQAAAAKFTEAQKWFAQARDWFAAQKQDDWAGRSRADQAEMELRLGRVKEARATTEPFAKDAAWAKNKHRPLGLYYHGLAAFLDKDLATAGRTLNQLAPFTDPAFGVHARYLVGRVLQLSGENAEASVHYDAVLADYEKAKNDAAVALQQPDRFKNNPFERARLVALAQGPAPEYIAGATFHGACISYEAGKFADALAKFAAFAKAYPTDPLTPDASLRTGFCQVQLKQHEEAIKTLLPLLEKTPRLADQAQFWIGKAQVALALQADPNNAADRESKSKAALESLRKAIERAQQLAQQNDAEAKLRRHEMQFELADALVLLKSPKEAAAVLENLWNEQALPNRREEILQRLASAQGAAGNLQACEDRCNEFRRLYPQSVLTPAVLFRLAENAYARATDAAKNKAADTKQKFEDAIARFKDIPAKYPEFERANHARYALGICLAQLGHLEEAIKSLEVIAAPDRVGELSGSAYLLADCLIRQTPVKAEDALQENQIREKLTAAAGLLDGYISQNPKSPETPAALLKLGFCQKRLGSTLADPNERNQTLQKAREAFEKLEREFTKDPLAAQATIEKAKVKAIQGDRGGAMNDLRSVLANAAAQPIAPLAAINLATMFREQNQPTEAAKVLDEARKKYEADLAKDAERAEWVHLLRYHHGVAILETNKPADARPVFELIVKEAGQRGVAVEAALRAGQCRVAEGRKQIQDGINGRNQAGNDMAKLAAAEQVITQGRAAIAEAAETLLQRAEAYKAALPNAEPRARSLYEAAWAFRELAVAEVEAARDALRKETHRKLIDATKAKLPPNAPLPNIPLPEIERAQVPVQKSEQRSFDAYKRLIDEFPETALSVEARFELAELRSARAEFDESIKLLKDALDKEPADRPVPADSLERIRLRLGAALYSQGDFAAASTQFETVAGNPKSPYLAQALYRAGECLFSQKEYAKAIEKLKIFRDNNQYHNVGGISDRAMLRLGQSLVANKEFEPGRQAFEVLLQRFGHGNPFAADARYGIGVAYAAQGKHDEAIKAFEQVIAATNAEVAAKAHMQIGASRMAQGKFAEGANAFLVVPLTYDYPTLGYAALLEAARAYEEGKMPALAAKMLEKVLKEAPSGSEWAKSAKEQLDKLPKQ